MSNQKTSGSTRIASIFKEAAEMGVTDKKFTAMKRLVIISILKI